MRDGADEEEHLRGHQHAAANLERVIERSAFLARANERRRERADLPFIGLIGSQTKWATFRHRLEARGFRADELAAVTCPIGVPGVVGKEPEVIAVAVAAQLLQQRVQG